MLSGREETLGHGRIHEIHAPQASVDYGAEGDVLPGSLLGPVVGLTFSTDGGLVFACVGSYLRVYDVHSGALLSTVRVFSSGLTVYGLDVGRNSLGAIFGDKCVHVVHGVPTGADALPCLSRRRETAGDTGPALESLSTGAAPPSDGRRPTENNAGGCEMAECVDATLPRRFWFRKAVHFTDLDDRVWDARLISGGASFADDAGSGTVEDVARGGTDGDGGKDEERRWKSEGVGMVAIALAHNVVEVWDWISRSSPRRLSRTRGGDPCLLYHARLWGRTLDDLKVACGTVFNQILVWNPVRAVFKNANIGKEIDKEDKQETGQAKAEGRTVFLGSEEVLRLKGHQGVIFRVAWREDGKQLASASDDRTLRVWDVTEDASASTGESRPESACTPDISPDCEGTAGRLLWTGWGHASRVWDVVFTSEGLVSCGEDGTAILWRECFIKEDLQNPGTAASSAITSTEAQAHHDHERHLVPVTTLRAHSRSHVWRLAVHESTRSLQESKSSKTARNMNGKVNLEGQSKNQGLVLLATGGNDGGIKLWDLGFEAGHERREPSGSRGGSLWGETAPVPAFHPCALASSVAVETTAKVATAEVATSSAGRASFPRIPEKYGNCDESLATAVDRQPPSVGAQYLKQTAGLSPSKSPPLRTDDKLGQGQYREDCAAKCGNGQHRRHSSKGRKKPAVVREVRLAANLPGGAAVLLADGSVWWVADLTVGTWQPVTISPPKYIVAPVTDSGRAFPEEQHDLMGGVEGATSENGESHARTEGTVDAAYEASSAACWTNSGVSSIAVFSIPRSTTAAAGEGDVMSVGLNGRGEAVDKHVDGNHPARGNPSDEETRCKKDDVAIVAGCDDGQLFVLTQSHQVKRDLSAGGGQTLRCPPPRPWRVITAWQGHRSRVTATWLVRDGTNSKIATGHKMTADPTCRSFTSAVDTSRLKAPVDGVAVNGALVSAGADGTVIWWDWNCDEEMTITEDDGKGGDYSNIGSSSSNNNETHVSPPEARMVGYAGHGVGITAAVIDDRRHSSGPSWPVTGEGQEKSPWPETTTFATGANEHVGALLEGGAMFCGDTKGSIYCFVEKPVALAERLQSAPQIATRDQEESATQPKQGSTFGVKGVPPCLVLKHQHGKDQISRIALQGCCLFSSGHDGNVNHYKISYPRSINQHANTSESSCTAGVEPSRGAEKCNDHRVSTDGRRFCGCGTSIPDTPPSAPFLPPTPSVVLTLVTCYAASPVTAVSDLWLGCEDYNDVTGVAGTCEAGDTFSVRVPRREKIRLAVAGQSGASRIRVWDLTEGRQLLELECGERHLAQDLILSWPTTTRDTFALHKRLVPPMGTHMLPTATSSSHGNAVGDAPVAFDRSRGGARNVTRLLLPLHTLVFAQSVARTEKNDGSICPQERNGSAGERRAADEERTTTVGKCLSSPVPGECIVSQQQQWPGVALAFHSSIFRPGRQSATQAEQGLHCKPLKHRQPENDLFPPDNSDQSSAPKTVSEREMGSTTESKPLHFCYSLEKAFHGQRAASAKFLPGEAPTASGTSIEDLRLVTGGEDGGVKVLDIFCERRHRSILTGDSSSSVFQNSRTPCPDSLPPSHGSPGTAYVRPYANVVQTLPSHESSVAALAIAIPAENTSGSGWDREAFIASGGGKMELRAWRTEGWRGNGINAGDERREGEAMVCAPPVRWLMTTTPAPRSPLHAHRIMCLCFLPPLSPPPSSLKSAVKNNGTVVMAGDSGGGVTVFELRDETGGATRGGGAAIGGSAGPQETRSRPAGRWTAPGSRPVLCLAHARVATRLAPLASRPSMPGNRCEETQAAVPFDGPDEEHSTAQSEARGGESIPDVLAHSSIRPREDMDTTAGRGNRERREAPEMSAVKINDGAEKQGEMEQECRSTGRTSDTLRERGRSHGEEKLTESVDLIITGDTGGTVTLWEFVPGGSVSRFAGASDPSRSAGIRNGFVHRGPAGRRRGGVGTHVKGAAKIPPFPGLVRVLGYRAHQMGVLSMAVHVPAAGDRLLIVTGGDDQAVCVAEVEVLPCDCDVLPTGGRSLSRGGCPGDARAGQEVPAKCRRLTIRLVEDAPQTMDGVAGSAIKGIGLLPLAPPITGSGAKSLWFTQQYPTTSTSASSGAAERRVGTTALALFTVSRDQRLSRWDLVKDRRRNAAHSTSSAAYGKHPVYNDPHSEQPLGHASIKGSGADEGGATATNLTPGMSAQGARQSRQNGCEGTSGMPLSRRWTLTWRAGCVTDVCDVSGIDVIAISSHPRHPIVSADDRQSSSPCSTDTSLPLSLDDHRPLIPSFSAKDEGINLDSQENESTSSEKGPTTGDVASCDRTATVSPAALVAVSGQGLQLVLFGMN